MLVVGLGPAGYTLAHYLLERRLRRRRHRRPEDRAAAATTLVGRDGQRAAADPATASDIYAELDERVLAGFGGVAEYGITVRWDKNFLTLIHLPLARREQLRASTAASASAAR